MSGKKQLSKVKEKQHTKIKKNMKETYGQKMKESGILLNQLT